jgi:hypothetical protein
MLDIGKLIFKRKIILMGLTVILGLSSFICNLIIYVVAIILATKGNSFV